MNTVAVRAKLRLRNDAMLRARERLGLSQKALADLADCPITTVAAYERFDYRVGNRATVERIAGALDLAATDVMPDGSSGMHVDSDHERRFQTSFQALPAPRPAVAMLESPMEATDDEADRKKQVQAALGAMTSAEKMVVQARFGLPPFDEPMTLEQLGQLANVTKERARQILGSGLNKAYRVVRELN